MVYLGVSTTGTPPPSESVTTAPDEISARVCSGPVSKRTSVSSERLVRVPDKKLTSAPPPFGVLKRSPAAMVLSSGATAPFKDAPSDRTTLPTTGRSAAAASDCATSHPTNSVQQTALVRKVLGMFTSLKGKSDTTSGSALASRMKCFWDWTYCSQST